MREEIVELYNDFNAGYSMNEGHQDSTRCVSKVIHHSQQHGMAEPFISGDKYRTKMTDGVLQVVELAKL